MLKTLPAFILTLSLCLQPAQAEQVICLDAQQHQAALNARATALGQNKNTQFILAEVQDEISGGYQRFFINKSDVDGDTAYAISRLIYHVFEDQRVLADAGDMAQIEQARLVYFWDLETAPRPVRINQIEGYATLAPATVSELVSAPEYQILRAANPGGFQQLLQLVANAQHMPDAQAFQYRNGLIMTWLRQHWNVQAVVLPGGDDA
ncbi:MAG TPA: hypothetical protein PKW15_02755 [Alphaproteobacteria bacterium]|nr:hypothetical protein [Rhodospirillaceae bacterium]HRJ12145.1 hypothetical protein [Alphaproteobacteria bacterium]